MARHYKLMAVQWCDSRVVNNVSSYMNFDIGQVRRRVGRIRQVVDCPQVLIHYQANMGGVDRGDQKRGHFGAFASYAHFKKWYKKTVMALLDCMMMNAHIMWNMSLESDAAKAMGRKRLERWEFMQVLAYELQTYETPSLKSPPRGGGGGDMEDPSRMETDPESVAVAPRVVHFPPDRRGRRCVVCQVEEPLIKACIREYKQANPMLVSECEVPKLVASMTKGNRKRLTACECCLQKQGGLSAHNFVFCEHDKKSIHSLFPADMSCMEILHSDVGKELWKRKTGNLSEGKQRMRVSTGHDYMTELKRILMAKVEAGLK